MKTIIFDTETNNIYPGQICQLSYLIKEGNDIRGRNYFFKVDYISPGAASVNGLSVEKLMNLSKGRTFSNYALEINNDFKGAELLIAHNVRFDVAFLKQEFSRCGYTFECKKTFCTMKGFIDICKLPYKNSESYKQPSLSELVNFFSIEFDEIASFTENIFGKGAGSFHDARYDTAALYLSLRKAAVKGILETPKLKELNFCLC